MKTRTKLHFLSISHKLYHKKLPNHPIPFQNENRFERLFFFEILDYDFPAMLHQ